jgi:hypothetical protein
MLSHLRANFLLLVLTVVLSCIVYPGILLAIGQTQRETMLSAARGEGLFPASGRGPLSLRFMDQKVGMTADVELIETAFPYHREVIARAKPDFVLGTEVRVASCEDLIVLRARSKEPGHRESIIELLRSCANRIDSGYLKRAAQAFGVLDDAVPEGFLAQLAFPFRGAPANGAGTEASGSGAQPVAE